MSLSRQQFTLINLLRTKNINNLPLIMNLTIEISIIALIEFLLIYYNLIKTIHFTILTF